METNLNVTIENNKIFVNIGLDTKLEGHENLKNRALISELNEEQYVEITKYMEIESKMAEKEIKQKINELLETIKNNIYVIANESFNEYQNKIKQKIKK